MISKSLDETKKIAREILAKLNSCAKSDLAMRSTISHKQKATILLLQGDLGSGKTTFVQFLAQELGIKNHLTSPTFVLIKKYGNFIHIDAYRLNQGQDLLSLGWTELVSDPKNLIVVEWPERVADLWDGTEHKINFKFIDEKTREITLV